MSNRKIWKPFVLTLLVVAALLALFYLPRFTIFGHEVRRTNILSDIQRLDADGRNLAVARADSAAGIIRPTLDSAAIQVHHEAHVDSVPEGMTPIEDFSLTEARVMDSFYAALSEAGNRPVRIAYFGDSYIEGDILTAHLRHYLQKRFGGQGVGFVDIDSETAGFRTTVAAKAKGWISHNANDERHLGFRKELQGINGRYYIPTSFASMDLRCTPGKIGTSLAQVELATVYFTPGKGMQLMASLNGGELKPLVSIGGTPDMVAEIKTQKDIIVDTIYTQQPDSQHPQGVFVLDTTFSEREVAVQTGIQKQGRIEHSTLSGNISRFHLAVTSGSDSRFYGVALDGRTGIAVDNFSMRGSNGWKLADIPAETLRDFGRLRPYDLIVLHYGLNVANEKQVDYSGYVKRMKQSISHLQAAFPDVSILVVSVADRDERGEDGGFHTMRGIRELTGYQRKMAADMHVAYWDLYKAMGGDGSLANMVVKHQANLDYTHINFAGGRHLASLLFDVLMNGKDNYEKRQ